MAGTASTQPQVDKEEIAEELFQSVVNQTTSLSQQQRFDVYEVLREKLGNEMDEIEDVLEEDEED